jgi:H/ACA ribonucleoprotein complex subunit 4
MGSESGDSNSPLPSAARGVVNVDKPRGPTSHEVTAWVKRLCGIDKAGHAGTLDPKVSGVLPVALGPATAVLEAMHAAPKEYVCVMRFHADVGRGVVDELAERFTGPVLQMPPLRSAVARRLRTRQVSALEILECEGRDLLFRVACEAGTYVRTLCRDMGLAAGCGGNMRELRRTRAGTFEEGSATPLHALADALELHRQGDEAPLSKILRPVDSLASHLPRVVMRDGAVDAVCHGAPLMVPGVEAFPDGCAKDSLVGMFTRSGEFVGLGVAAVGAAEFQGTRRGVAVRTKRVVMPRGTYRKGWQPGAARP